MIWSLELPSDFIFSFIIFSNIKYYKINKYVTKLPLSFFYYRSWKVIASLPFILTLHKLIRSYFFFFFRITSRFFFDSYLSFFFSFCYVKWRSKVKYDIRKHARIKKERWQNDEREQPQAKVNLEFSNINDDLDFFIRRNEITR